MFKLFLWLSGEELEEKRIEISNSFDYCDEFEEDVNKLRCALFIPSIQYGDELIADVIHFTNFSFNSRTSTIFMNTPRGISVQLLENTIVKIITPSTIRVFSSNLYLSLPLS